MPSGGGVHSINIESRLTLKVFRVLGERYRNKRRRYGIKVNIIAGIVNLLMGF